MFWIAFWVIHACIYWIVMIDFVIFIERRFLHRQVPKLLTEKTIDILCLFWLVPQICIAGTFGRIWCGLFTIIIIYRLAKDDYPDDDDDTRGKRLLSWGKSKIPKPYVKPIPVPI